MREETEEQSSDAARSEATNLIRGGLTRSAFDETAEAIFPTSGYVYGSAAEAEAAFAGDLDRYIYSRYGNPTVSMFEERLRLIEGAEAVMATASGMSAAETTTTATLCSKSASVARSQPTRLRLFSVTRSTAFPSTAPWVAWTWNATKS